MEVSPSQERRLSPASQGIEPVSPSSPRRAGTPIGLIATMPRSGTWYNNLFFHYYMQLLEGKEDLSVIDKGINVILSDRTMKLGVRNFLIGHMDCPGFFRYQGRMREKWDALQYLDGFDWASEALRELDTTGDSDPFVNANVRIIYYYRNPLDQAISSFQHQYQQNALSPFKTERDYLFKGGLDSFIKQYFTFCAVARLCPEQVLLVTYETLIRQAAQSFLRVLAFLGHDIRDPAHQERIGIALRLASKDALQQLERQLGHSIAADQIDPTRSHVKDGAIGKWKGYFDQGDVDTVKRRLAEFGMALSEFELE